MERRNNLTAAQIVGNLELANQALKRYVLTLEEKIAQYERVLTQCPRFRAEQSSAIARHEVYDEFCEDAEAGLIDDDWDGLEEDDFDDEPDDFDLWDEEFWAE